MYIVYHDKKRHMRVIVATTFEDRSFGTAIIEEGGTVSAGDFAPDHDPGIALDSSSEGQFASITALKSALRHPEELYEGVTPPCFVENHLRGSQSRKKPFPFNWPLPADIEHIMRNRY